MARWHYLLILRSQNDLRKSQRIFHTRKQLFKDKIKNFVYQRNERFITIQKYWHGEVIIRL